MKMLNIRKCLTVASPLKNCVLFSSTIRPSKKPAHLNSRGQTKRRPQTRFGPNPGVQLQMSALQQNEKDISNPDFLEDMEKQFWDVDKIQDVVDREQHLHKELHGIYQVTRKQFKEDKAPNMLTWDEKQEIKTLHAQDPEKWTIMKLAYSYPASPPIIKKVLRAKWKIRTAAEIERHDERVRKNWEALFKGNLNVPDEDLRKHLISFTDRSKILSTNSKELVSRSTANEDILKDVLKDGGVFGNIYKSYKRETQQDTDKHAENTDQEVKEDNSIEVGLSKLYHPPQHETFIIPRSAQNVKLRTSEHVTLGHMKDRVLYDFEADQPLSNDERGFIETHFQKKSKETSHIYLKDPIGINPKIEHVVNNNKKESIHDKLRKIAGYSKEPSDNEMPLHQESSHENPIPHPVTSREPINKKSESIPEVMNVPRVSPYHGQEDREVLASFKTAMLERSQTDDETIVKAVKNYLSSSSESYPLEISIPKDVWKKGALYRVKDRFYTDDGEFLFRVPGLVKE